MKTYTLKSDGNLSRYNYLWRMTADRWAWEYLRRNPEFLEDAKTFDETSRSERTVCHGIRILKSRVPQTKAERWGLIMMPDPSLDAIEADVVWSKTVFPDQVEINVIPRGENETCEIYDTSVKLARITHLTDSIGREYLLTRGNGCVFQTCCQGLSLLGMDRVRMKLQISDFESFDRKVKAQQEGMRVFGDDPEAQTPLWTKKTQILRDGLIALDCIAQGLSQREIGVVLYGEQVVSENWAQGQSALRNQVRYVIRKAEGLRDGGYLVELLGARLGPDT
jgi:hypothetical protein